MMNMNRDSVVVTESVNSKLALNHNQTAVVTTKSRRIKIINHNQTTMSHLMTTKQRALHPNHNQTIVGAKKITLNHNQTVLPAPKPSRAMSSNHNQVFI